jgi:predicted transcriptional regulator
MSVSRSRRSRVFTISFPEDLARQVDQVARQESRTFSELFREAFRMYRLERIHAQLDVARKRKPGTEYKEEDVEELVNEIRSKNDVGKNRR